VIISIEINVGVFKKISSCNTALPASMDKKLSQYAFVGLQKMITFIEIFFQNRRR